MFLLTMLKKRRILFEVEITFVAFVGLEIAVRVHVLNERDFL